MLYFTYCPLADILYMSAERPTFYLATSQKPQAEAPKNIIVETIQATITPVAEKIQTLPIVECVPPKTEKTPPTERELFWRNMYQTGELSPYKKNKGPVKFDALRDASYEAITDPFAAMQHLGEHIRAIDTDFRGGVDIGDAKTRLMRMAVMAGNMVPFIVFDTVTSIPGNILGKVLETNMNKGQIGKDKYNISTATVGAIAGFKRAVEVGNDKFTTALADIWVTKLTGEKGAWTHEASDKSGDFLNSAVPEYIEDFVNGPVVESGMRFLYQIPIFGALVEQGWTRLSK